MGIISTLSRKIIINELIYSLYVVSFYWSTHCTDWQLEEFQCELQKILLEWGTPMAVKMTVSWTVRPWSCHKQRHLREIQCPNLQGRLVILAWLTHQIWSGGDMFLHNVGLPPNYTVWHYTMRKYGGIGGTSTHPGPGSRWKWSPSRLGCYTSGQKSRVPTG